MPHDGVNIVNLRSDLNGAMAMLGQAQDRCKQGSELYKQLGKMYDEIDSLFDAVKDDSEGYYLEQLK